MKTRMLSWVVLVVLFSAGVSLRAGVLYSNDCSSTAGWSGTSSARILTSRGFFDLTCTTSEFNINVTTTQTFSAASFRLSVEGVKHYTGWNFSTAYLQVGLDQSGVDNLAVRLTYWGDNAKFYYNGTAYAFSLDARPVGYYGNVSLIVEYFNVTSTGVSGGRVKITQLSGSYKKPSNGTVNNSSYNNAAGTVVVDQDFPGAPLATGLHKLKIVGSAGNYGTGSTIDNIVLSGY